MKTLKVRGALFASLCVLAVPYAASAQVGGGPVCDVDEIEVEQATGVETPAERVARLERALDASLSQHDECLQTLSASASGGASGSGGSVASGTAEGTGAGGQSGSTGQQNTDRPAETDDPQSQDTDVANVRTGPQGTGDRQDRTGPPIGETALDNGAIPEDIPPGDDDDVVAQQIREAALAEPDPNVRARLWEDYRKYKGLPPAADAD